MARERDTEERRPQAFWYRVGGTGPRVIQAVDEEAAREAVLARHPEARGQRITLELWRV